jgi:RimJ/RimL family protein N-acetyltransferase
VGANVVFFAWSGGSETLPSELTSLPPGLSRAVWRPSWRRVRPLGVKGTPWVVWWCLHQLRLFGNREYSVVLVRDATGQVVHRASVFPPYLRFPFMAKEDVQLGDLWTAPQWRGKGLASSSLRYLVAERRTSGRCFWYLTAPTNAASVRVAQRAGFRFVATGSRESRWGLSALGAFRMNRPVGDDAQP